MQYCKEMWPSVRGVPPAAVWRKNVLKSTFHWWESVILNKTRTSPVFSHVLYSVWPHGFPRTRTTKCSFFNLEVKHQAPYWTLYSTVIPLTWDRRRACAFSSSMRNAQKRFFGSSRLWLMSSISHALPSHRFIRTHFYSMYKHNAKHTFSHWQWM